MLYVAYDNAYVSPDRQHYYIEANGLRRTDRGVYLSNISRPGLTAIFAVTNTRNLAVANTEALVREGKPFVYPIDVGGWHILHALPGRTGQGFTSIPADLLVVPPAVLSAARKGTAVIVFCYAWEADVLAYVHPDGRFWIHDFVEGFRRSHDLPPASLWMLSGNQASGEEHAEWLAARGVRAEESFRFRTVDSFNTTYKYAYHFRKSGKDYVWKSAAYRPTGHYAVNVRIREPAVPFAERYVSPETVLEDIRAGRRRSRHFVCMNGAPRPARRVFLSALAVSDALRKGYASFPAMTEHEFTDGGGSAEFGFAAAFGDAPDLRDLLARAWGRIGKDLPLEVDAGDVWKTRRDVSELAADPDVSDMWYSNDLIGSSFPFRDSYVNFVNETYFTSGDRVAITEKIMKAIVHLQPFVPVSSRGTIAHLKRQGFRTFGRLIDETYDDVADNAERMRRILAVVERIAALDAGEIFGLYEALLPEILHNHAHLATGVHTHEGAYAEMAALLGEEWRPACG